MDGIQTIVIDEFAYDIPTGYYPEQKIVVTPTNIQALPHINRIIYGHGMNEEKSIADIQLRGFIRTLQKHGVNLNKRLQNASE